jgi:hypothetical protein
VTEVPEPEAIQILDDLLGGSVSAAPNPARAAPPVPIAAPLPPQPVQQPPQSIIPPQPTTAAQQTVPGTTPAVKQPMSTAMPSVVTRASVISKGVEEASAVIDPATADNFETNFAKLLTKDLELAKHDRDMAIALFQTHLDRAEILDQMQLSMPVATVIADNTGATLKSLELAMKAGERVHKAAELLVNAQRNSDIASLTAFKLKQGQKEGWDAGDLPSENNR